MKRKRRKPGTGKGRIRPVYLNSPRTLAALVRRIEAIAAREQWASTVRVAVAA